MKKKRKHKKHKKHIKKKGAYKEDLKADFIKAVEEHCFVGTSARAIGIHPNTAYDWLNPKSQVYDPKLAEAYRGAIRVTMDELKTSAMKRAKKSSDALAKFFLRNLDSEFKDKVVKEVPRETVDYLVNGFIDAIRKIPNICPHCKTSLNLDVKIAEQLRELSTRFAGA